MEEEKKYLKSRGVIFVVLCYYPDYLKSIIKLCSNFQRHYPNSTYIIVNNSRGKLELPIGLDNFSIVDGDNRYWEFSGWEVAREMIVSNLGLSCEQQVVFMNDTVLKHRLYTFYDKYLFIRKLDALFNKKKPYLVGEYSPLDSDKSISGLSINGWVSTYLFACNLSFLKKCKSMHYSKDEIEGLVTGANKNEIEFSKEVSSELQKYLNSWLYPSQKTTGWYNNSASPELKKMKVVAILNEKRLAALCQFYCGDLISIYERLHHKVYKKVVRTIYGRLLK